MNDNILHANKCVFVSHYETVCGTDGKRHRVERVVPKVYGVTIYTIHPIDGTRPFVGWTYEALRRGLSAKHYGKCIVLSPEMSAVNVAEWLQRYLDAALLYGRPWFGGSRVLIEWNGEHRDNFVTIDGVEVEMCGCGDAAPDTTGYGNLAWALVTGLCRNHTEQSLALIDLEWIRGGDDPYVNVVHAVRRDYANGGVYLSDVTHVFSERARRLVERRRNLERVM